MKFTLEPAEQDELEIIIRGDCNDPRIPRIIAALNAAKVISRLFLYRDEKEYLCPVSEIIYFEALHGKIYAHTAQGILETRYKLYELADMLRSSGFIQISKGILVNIHEVVSVEPEFSGNYTAVLNSHKVRLTISRKYFKAFREYVVKEL
ncbi:MAG: LytTR family DNA-binding domain-containing protein [Eubacteriales bacterium]|nr:LytTR family DNA-binding domain-containing protein [Eubacteriales bacterium]